ncbi:uncharacterized protein UTRI_06557_B [Ustilago trichophora]|uniref:Uncharacterized protein n=1 Tax=Ustilago trichophora TaxID=86804 RepID=A0A5C3EPR7_9BASI|nr:uncharacterized protein UTRI_06557_B [Ustilago trichophora]
MTSNSANSNNNSIGDAVKGALNTIHGAGESIRGNINQTLDSAGEGIRNSDSHNSTSTNTFQPPATHGKSRDYDNPTASQQGIADKGAQEFKQGIDKLSSAFNANTSHNNSTTH